MECLCFPEENKVRVPRLPRRRLLLRSSENSLIWIIKMDPITVQQPNTPPPIGGFERRDWIGEVVEKFANFYAEKPGPNWMISLSI
jgi:hypothetical protein